MARRSIERGDLWLYRFPTPDKRRPVVVLTRNEAIPFLDLLLVAPITSTVRDIPSEVPLGIQHGLKAPSVANLDHVQVARKAGFERWIGRLDAVMMRRLCAALAVATGCS